jgi:hypothetical protein
VFFHTYPIEWPEELREMTENPKDSSLRRRIFESMQEMDTKELLSIWTKNNRQEWSAEAFEVIREILQERTGNVPEQGAPTSQVQPEEQVAQKAAIERVEKEKTWHDPQIIVTTAKLANIGAWIALFLGAVLFVSRLVAELNVDPAMTSYPARWSTLLYSLTGSLLSAIVNFIILRAVSHVLYLVLDIERNTYLAAKRNTVWLPGERQTAE